MNFLRVSTAVLLLALFAGPLIGPGWAVARDPSSFGAWRESGRIAELLRSTFTLFALTSLIAIPVGLAWSLAIERFAIRGRNTLRLLMFVALFVPLPVYAVAWQVVFGSWLPPLSLEPGQIAWRPWNRGLLPAAWIHGMAGLPWVVLFSSIAIGRIDCGLEDETRLLGGTRLLLVRLAFPRLALAAVGGLVWLLVQTSTEIAVTDAMMVRSFAEEVYTQLVIGGNGIASALALALPVGIAIAILILASTRRWLPRLQRISEESNTSRSVWPLDRVSKICFNGFAWAVAFLAIGLPVCGLIWKSCGGGTSTGAEVSQFFPRLFAVLKTEGSCILTSLTSALGTGLFTATLAWLACWAALRSAVFRGLLLILCVLLFTTPGPILGFGLKATIRVLLDAEDFVLARILSNFEFPPMSSLLYDQPTPVPAMWAAVLRFFPVACLILWPAMRAIPTAYAETLMIDGRGWWSEGRWVVAPFTANAFRVAALAIAALTLGEVGTAKLVNPPFYNVYILRVFDQMHYGSESIVAMMALVQLLMTSFLAAFGLPKPQSPGATA